MTRWSMNSIAGLTPAIVRRANCETSATTTATLTTFIRAGLTHAKIPLSGSERTAPFGHPVAEDAQ